ncbi:MAG TPA: hypothetical protein DEF36_20175 [Desulfotomaculum sp.]|nr:hypothetical protein [Desulfotomaculum sp.]
MGKQINAIRQMCKIISFLKKHSKQSFLIIKTTSDNSPHGKHSTCFYTAVSDSSNNNAIHTYISSFILNPDIDWNGTKPN